MPKPPVSNLLLWSSWAALVSERVAREFWPLLTFLTALAGCALLGLVPFGPFWLRWLVWVLQLGLTLWLAGAGFRRFVWPDRATVLRAIETANNLRHRPLSQAADQIAGGQETPETRAIWQVHRQRLAATVSSLRLPLPKALVAERDPIASRVAAMLTLFVGLAFAGQDAPDRIARVLLPPVQADAAATQASIELWFTPPDYTGLSPLYLDAAKATPAELAVPAGSRLLVQVRGVASVPVLHLYDLEQRFPDNPDHNYALTVRLPKITRLTLQVGATNALSVPIRIVEDMPPKVAWTHPARRTAHGTLDLRYKATDDYGVAKLDLLVTPIDPVTRKPRIADAARIALALPSPPGREVTSEAFPDLTASPWAGLPVSLRLSAHDAIGQRGDSTELSVVLPERVFHNPVAQAIIAARKSIVRSASGVDAAAAALDGLSQHPDAFRDDLRIFLALRVAARQLVNDSSPESRKSVAALLWRAAIRAEDGAAGQAEQDLRAAENALRDAIAHHASAAEIHRLTNAVRQAISQYLQAMMQNRQGGNPGQASPGNGAGRSVTSPQIEKMLERAEALAAAGDQAGADAVMAQLQRLMESLQFGSAQDSGGAQALQDVTELAREQQRQLDRTTQDATTKTAQSGQSRTSAESGKEQEHLHDKLVDLMRRLGRSGIPSFSDLDHAGNAMSDAAKSLRAGQTGKAIPAQGKALDRLRAAAQSMAKSMQQQGGAGSEEQMTEDPLGRHTEDGSSREGDDIDIPTETTTTQSRQILNELRRRQGDLQRPQGERDYIDRLLENF
jgi:uncharacterized protein (TIGR02302 family)